MSKIIRKIKLSKIIDLSSDPDIIKVNKVIDIIVQLRGVKTPFDDMFRYVIGDEVYISQYLDVMLLICHYENLWKLLVTDVLDHSDKVTEEITKVLDYLFKRYLKLVNDLIPEKFSDISNYKTQLSF